MCEDNGGGWDGGSNDDDHTLTLLCLCVYLEWSLRMRWSQRRPTLFDEPRTRPLHHLLRRLLARLLPLTPSLRHHLLGIERSDGKMMIC